MNIALIGYGKMGKIIESIAVSKGHSVTLKIDITNADMLTLENLQQCDVAIEFTGPHSAFDNVMKCLEANIPVVCGSTGWLSRYSEAVDYCHQQQGTLLYASNFSVGVNLFFEVNKVLAGLMANLPDYDVQITEIHHTEKKDAPSGTAITLAEQILGLVDRKKAWANATTNDTETLSIISKRIDPAPGTHKICYTSAIDDIEIIHTAHNRNGFATGAVMAAAFLYNKKGVFSMKDVLGF
jgi:4-hydroxy-tetrahydrodipicolinate reductase